MTSNIKIARSVIERLRGSTCDHVGESYGVICGDNVIVLGYHIDESLDSNCDFGDWMNKYPAGINVCGLLKISSKEIDMTDNTVIGKLKAPDRKYKFLLFKTLDKTDLRCFVLQNDCIIKSEIDVLEADDVENLLVSLRIKSQIIIELESLSKESLIINFNDIKNIVSTNGIMFRFKQTNICLHPCNINCAVLNTKLENIHSTIESLPEVRNVEIQNPLEVLPVFVTTNGAIKDPLTYTYIDDTSMYNMHLPLDVFCVAVKSSLVRDTYDILKEAVLRWLELIYNHFIYQCSDSQFTQFELCHFYPKPLGHFFSTVIPNAKSEDVLAQKRLYFHKILDLPLNRPFFRRGNVIEFGKRDVLFNVHRGLRHERVSNGKISLVQGEYGYYHYMQKSYNDKGWGCAYRSFQTIFSWFRLQGYTTKEIPDHKAIQECLVKLGDKPASFIGTKSWIGSTEISFCLDDMLGINSIILSVSSGEELNTLGNQLDYHFNTAGTPVMIGGGNLAHTILGIDFNEEAGDIKFLILDPHYVSPTGNEVLKHIQTKGGVFWKGIEFWSSKNFYNLCLPQPPVYY